MSDEQAIVKREDNAAAWELVQRRAKAMASSTLLPDSFRGNVGNCLIALDMADRLRANPLMVAQSIYIVHGKPSWASTFIIGMLNSCGRFEPARFEMKGTGDKRSCIAWTKVKGTDERLEGPEVSIEMAKAEGWYSKNGSKWKTMPELMLRYRAATFFGRLYAPELLLGMRTEDEIIDIEASRVPDKIDPEEMFGKRKEVEDTTTAESANPSETPNSSSEPEPPTESPSQLRGQHPQEALANIVINAGFTFDDFQKWALETGHIDQEYGSFEELPAAVAQKWVEHKGGMLSGLALGKGAK